MALFSAFFRKKTIFTAQLALILSLGAFSTAYAYEDNPDGWTNDHAYAISDNLGWLSRHRINGECSIALISYSRTKAGMVFVSMPLEILATKNGSFIRSANTVKGLSPDDEVKVRFRVGQSKYLIPLAAESDPTLLSAELEEKQLQLILDLFEKSHSIGIEFPSDKKTAYYPLYRMRPLLLSFKSCIFINGFADLE
ncbi:hypothetical protein FAI40_04870 [Acetobacteraceae bacterium]|nr:hypothetical protein FAI40_04870 [Acetobacteraceae bacterium]